MTFALDLLVCVSEWRLTPGLGRNTQVGWARSFQRGLKKATGFTLPFVYGRGLFGVPVGMLPHRVPLTSVVGAPISVPKFTGDLALLQHGVMCLRQDAILIQRNLIAVSRREYCCVLVAVLVHFKVLFSPVPPLLAADEERTDPA